MKELFLNCSLNFRRGGGGLLAFLYVVFSCVLWRFSIRCPGSGVVWIVYIHDLCLLPYSGILADVDGSVSVCPIGVVVIARLLDSFIRLD